jgi:hypothetical protein
LVLMPQWWITVCRWMESAFGLLFDEESSVTGTSLLFVLRKGY